jgi:hypothetical protein
MRVVALSRGTLLYKRTFKALTALPTAGFSWFALTLGYGSDDTYGPVISTWRVQRQLRLLNISRTEDRVALASYGDVSCNSQYSGGAGNEAFHRRILPLLAEHNLDGTFISESDADEECSGATEVVLRLRPNATLVKKL